MTAIAINPFVTYTDASGLPLAGGKIYTYAAGTTTPQATYTDATQISTATNPIVLDTAGRVTYGAIWGSGSYKLRLTTSTDVDIYTVDNVQATATIPDGTTISTPTAGDNSTKISNTAFTQNAINIYSAGFINKFRNASLDIWQRGNSITVTAGSPAYTADGWIVSCTGANIVVSKSSSALNSSYNSMLLTGATSVTGTTVKQRIEGAFAWQMYRAGSNITVQCIVSNNTGASITPTLTVAIPTAIDNYTGVTTVVNAASLQPVSNSTTVVLSYTFSTPSNLANGMEVTFDFGAILTSGAKSVQLSAFDIRSTPGVPVGLNGNPPQPELRPISIEYVINQRYVRTSFSVGTTPAQNAGVTNAFEFSQTRGASTNGFPPKVLFDQPMFAAPTVTIYNPSAANAQIRNFGTGTDGSLTSVFASYANGFNVQYTSPAASSIGDICGFHYFATAEL